MKEFTTGMPAVSKAGHDTGKTYIVIRTDDEYVYLADGTIRTLDRLKKKRRKHIQINYQIPESLREAIETGHPLRDEQIKKAIKEFSQKQEV